MKTAQSIEAQEERKLPQQPVGTVTRKDLAAARKIVGKSKRMLTRKEKKALHGKQANGKPLSQYPLGKHPGSHTAAGNRYKTTLSKLSIWEPGQSGNPNGRAQSDVARKIARAIFENNQEALYESYGAAALAGNAYAFQVLADRAYGKLKEHVAHEVTAHSDLTNTDLVERIAQLERDLGYSSGQVGQTGTACLPPPGTLPPGGSQTN